MNLTEEELALFPEHNKLKEAKDDNKPTIESQKINRFIRS